MGVSRGDRFGFSDAVLLVALGMSLSLNVYQYNRDANAVPTSSSRAELPKTGQEISEVHLISIDGTPQTLSLAAQPLPTVVYVMSPECKWCQSNLKKINGLAANLNGKYRVVGLSPHLSPAARSLGYTFPLFTLDPKFPSPPITLDLTPRTLVFSKEGKLDMQWDGAYSSGTEGDITSYFHVHSLPES